MSRVAVYVDGFNLYHAIADSREFRSFRWLDLAALAQCFFTKSDTIVDVAYFTTYVTWSPDKHARHLTYVRALETRGVRVVFGEFKRRDMKCPKCGAQYLKYEEKQTDVNLAIELFEGSVNDRFDKALIVSGDSDLIPAIKAVKKLFPAKRIGIAIPPGRPAKQLTEISDFHFKIKSHQLQSCQLQTDIALSDGTILKKPAAW